MTNFFKTLGLVLALVIVQSATAVAQTTKYKCMVQMTNYMGDGAYIVISLIDSKGAYEKTLYVLGSDKKWYKTLKEWNKFYLKKPSAVVSAITGASVTGGDRSVNVIEIENSKINAGYKLRFESAVEDKAYNVKDVEIPLTTQALDAKTEGTGYIRYVRFSAN
ncbi:DUF2271 domain-containing protein [Mucilaginibacter auburnensis]|uniref:Uncharacterized protein DUF2271 n=1 Tax=Mucilaginibacter auburnensis TaxID=1457233 RepID=A0A2H9VRV4_9SPHI|nr:DUF2271 domain-containing protein [Mucilaginibacter auburnensis]PJJ83529.1 uncharacterized protein DUF2271 [Mucilaginibacter auburnensis]